MEQFFGIVFIVGIIYMAFNVIVTSTNSGEDASSKWEKINKKNRSK